MQAAGCRSGQLLSQQWLVSIEGRGSKVDHHIRPLWDQLSDWVGAFQPFPLQGVVHPQVFADGEPQPLAIGELQQVWTRPWTEVAPLIKNVVTGQQLFVGNGAPSPPVDEGDAVGEPGGAVVVRG